MIYAKIVADMLSATDTDKHSALHQSLTQCKSYLEQHPDKAIAHEIKPYSRLWNEEGFTDMPEDEIKSSGYVLHTLEAAIWCFLNTDNYKDCVLKAINLGEDTDTVGAVTGGLAGLYYGMVAIPKEWIELLPKREWIEGLIEQLEKSWE